MTWTPEEKSFDQVPRKILDCLTHFETPTVCGIDPPVECLDAAGGAVPIDL